MGRGDQFGFFNYQSDDTNSYLVKLSLEVAGQGAFGSQVDPNSGPYYPFGAKNMRHVWGLGGGAHGPIRTRCPIGRPDNAKFISGGTFSLGGTVYTIQGAIGEKRKLNSVS